MTMKTFEEIKDSFLSDREVAVSKATYDSYESKFNVISAWVKANRVSAWDDRAVANLFHYLVSERGLDKSTCHNYKMALNVFFNFSLRWGYLTTKPSFDLVTFPKKKEDKGAVVMSQPDLRKLLKTVERDKKQLHLAFMTEYYCALRPGNEIRLMKVSEVDLKSGVFRISPSRAKSRRKEIVTMPEQLVALYTDYLSGGDKKDYYVFGKGGKPGRVPWSENTLRNQFNRFRDNLKMPKSYKLYSGKHSGLTRLAESGIPVHSIMEHARHTSLTVTQRYLKKHGGLTDERIRFSFPNP